MKEEKYSIKDLERLSGIKAHTLRIWEKRYEILSPERTLTNIRFYSDADLRKILNVALLNRHGYKISYLANLSDEALGEKVTSLSQNEFMKDIQIDTLLSAMIHLDESKFDKILNKAIIHYGFEETLTRVIYPLFEKIGILWQTNAITPAHEHFISNLIRLKLLVAIDGLMINEKADAKTFFLFLPDGEWHELGLIILYYFIKKSGHKVIYFGQSLPFSSLVEASKSMYPDYLLTLITCSLPDDNAEGFIRKISQKFPSITTFIGGLQMNDSEISLPGNISLIPSLPEFKQALLSLA